MSEVVRAISEGRFIDFSNPAYDGNKGKKSHHLNQSLLPAAAAKRRNKALIKIGPSKLKKGNKSRKQISPTNSPIHSPLQQSVTSPQSPNRLTVSQQSQKPKKKQKVKQKVVKKNKEKDKINDKEKVELKFGPLKIENQENNNKETEKKEDPEKKEEAKEEKKEEDEPKEGDKQLPATQRSHESLKSYTSYSSTFTRITTVQNKTLHQQNQIK
ncbi:MAG: hypothetical protein EZS28_039417, partial [Streblomastix strix]